MTGNDSAPNSSSRINDQSLSYPHAQLVKISCLYYLENIGMKEIAERLNVSVPTVSRALAKARELRIVNITIEGGNTQSAKLEIEMEETFSLKECLIVSGFDSMEAVYRQMAIASADLFRRALKPGNLIGVSWGETMKAVGENLQSVPLENIGVVPIIGAMGKIETGIYPNSIVRTFAGKLKGNAYLINTPALVDSAEVRKSLMEDSSFKPVRELWERLDMAILGVSGLGVESSVYREGIFNEEELCNAGQGSVSASNFMLFDSKGKIVQTIFHDCFNSKRP